MSDRSAWVLAAAGVVPALLLGWSAYGQSVMALAATTALVASIIGPARAGLDQTAVWGWLRAGLAAAVLAWLLLAPPAALPLGTRLEAAAPALLMVSYGCLLVFLIQVGRHRRVPPDRGVWLDVALVAVAVATVVSDALLRPRGALADEPAELLAFAALPLAAAACAAALAYLLLTGGQRVASAWLLSAAIVLVLGGDLAFLVGGGAYTAPIELSWLVGYGLATIGMVHPSLPWLLETGTAARRAGWRAQMLLTGLAALALPLVLLVGAGASPFEGVQVAAVLAVLGLMLWRVLRLLRERETLIVARDRRARRAAHLEAISRAAVASDDPRALLDRLAAEVGAALGAAATVAAAGPDDDPRSQASTVRITPARVLVIEAGDHGPPSPEDLAFLRAAADIAHAATARMEAEQQLRAQAGGDPMAVSAAPPAPGRPRPR